MERRIGNRFYRHILILFLVRLNLSFIYTNEHEREEYAGQNDYISKPIKCDVVFKREKMDTQERINLY